MSDDTSERGGADRKRINPNEDYEVRYWSEKFGVAPEILKEAVKHVGPMVEDVQRAVVK